MTVTRPRPGNPHALIDAAIAAHGAGAVLRRALRALLATRREPPDVAALGDHLRRDIGLPPAGPPPRRPGPL